MAFNILTVLCLDPVQADPSCRRLLMLPSQHRASDIGFDAVRAEPVEARTKLSNDVALSRRSWRTEHEKLTPLASPPLCYRTQRCRLLGRAAQPLKAREMILHELPPLR